MNQHPQLPRRVFKADDKIKMVKAALRREDSIAGLARRFSVNQNQLSRWIREYQNSAKWAQQEQSETTSFIPVDLINAPKPLPEKQTVPALVSSKPSTSLSSVSASVDFASGHRLVVSGLDVNHLKLMLEVLS